MPFTLRPPPQVYDWLKAIAHQRRKSLNETVIWLIREHYRGLTPDQRKRLDEWIEEGKRQQEEEDSEVVG